MIECGSQFDPCTLSGWILRMMLWKVVARSQLLGGLASAA
jgi:hypothetical protein